MAESRKISLQEAETCGITASAKVVDQHEVRVRTAFADGCGSASLTDRADNGGWQAAHKHSPGIVETYFILRGWVGLAVLEKGVARYRRHVAGETFKLEHDEGHTLFVSAGTKMITVKTGTSITGDWIPVPELDQIVFKVNLAVFSPLG